MGRLDGKVCIVTGASGGIGAKTAEFYGREGAKVVLAARRENYLNAVAKKVRDAGGEALVVVTDIRDKAQAEALVEKTAALLAERQDTLAKSKAQQEKVERRRERLIASKEKPAKQPRARKNVAAEDPQMMELKALLASKNMTMEEMLATLRK